MLCLCLWMFRKQNKNRSKVKWFLHTHTLSMNYFVVYFKYSFFGMGEMRICVRILFRWLLLLFFSICSVHIPAVPLRSRQLSSSLFSWSDERMALCFPKNSATKGWTTCTLYMYISHTFCIVLTHAPTKNGEGKKRLEVSSLSRLYWTVYVFTFTMALHRWLLLYLYISFCYFFEIFQILQFIYIIQFRSFVCFSLPYISLSLAKWQ